MVQGPTGPTGPSSTSLIAPTWLFMYGVENSGSFWQPGCLQTNQILFSDGAQSEPVIAFQTDPSSGIYHTDASNVAIVVGGERKLLITNAEAQEQDQIIQLMELMLEYQEDNGTHLVGYNV